MKATKIRELLIFAFHKSKKDFNVFRRRFGCVVIPQKLGLAGKKIEHIVPPRLAYHCYYYDHCIPSSNFSLNKGREHKLSALIPLVSHRRPDGMIKKK